MKFSGAALAFYLFLCYTDHDNESYVPNGRLRGLAVQIRGEL